MKKVDSIRKPAWEKIFFVLKIFKIILVTPVSVLKNYSVYSRKGKPIQGSRKHNFNNKFNNKCVILRCYINCVNITFFIQMVNLTIIQI